jgi:hypothetical protein
MRRHAGVALFAFSLGAALFALTLRAAPAAAIERNFAGSAQLDYFFVPDATSAPTGRDVFDGFTAEVAMKMAADVSDHLSATVKVCYGCHGFELPMAYFDYRVADALTVRVGRFSPSFGAFNIRQDPANHSTSDKPLPYDMGRMLRLTEWNLGVLPSPFPDNGVEIEGTHWFGEGAQLDWAAYTVSGFRAPTGAADLTWGLSQTRGGNMIDNNGRPAGGGRVAATFRIGEGNDLTVGGSVMYGTWDPANRYTYLIGGADLSARIGRTQLRLEYLVRRQTFAPDPMVPFKLAVPASGEDQFEKHGAYIEIERSMTETVNLLLRADGLYRAGNNPVASPLATRAAVFRTTAAGTLAIAPGFRLKASAELWAFTNDPPFNQDRALAFHLAVVGTF